MNNTTTYALEVDADAVGRMTPEQRQLTRYNIGCASRDLVASADDLLQSVPDWQRWTDRELAQGNANFYNQRGPFDWVRVVVATS